MQILNRYTQGVIFENGRTTLRRCVEDAVRKGVSLRRADLWDADLQDANLRSADLRGANLRGANLRGAKGFLLLPVQDMCGYSFAHAAETETGWRVRVGCRDFSITEAREHWGDTYTGDREQGDLYLAAIDWLERKVGGAA